MRNIVFAYKYISVSVMLSLHAYLVGAIALRHVGSQHFWTIVILQSARMQHRDPSRDTACKPSNDCLGSAGSTTEGHHQHHTVL